ncbi:MAG: SusC/RagA family TonB-linked outer membrane protein [Cyclobacteriaceae bacterium]|nr:SusC/RagA family TonB-linked outer membrane protein [Cyclobacteriaceae bacterium]UYN86527.1 MAG: SusC/RagA family TonB-linked outer membrane protein [Cyclobacteriaceae bacterium]
MKKFLLFFFALLVLGGPLLAQERTVTGKVTSADDGSPLPGVNVVIKGSTAGTVTDSEGNYRISGVPASGGTLIFSFIGLQTQEVLIGDRTTINVSLASDIQQLSEVVVTAQGIQREQKALGYATTTISSALLAEKPETDIGRALQGRTPGLQILNASGLAGSSSRINIRGNSSINGDTQPLWIVDGVPINTQSNDINQNFVDGQVAPTRFLDIDPNNIESISVLRGLSATTTYGSQGRNGVILITTKTGSRATKQNKFTGAVSQSYFVVEAVIPEYQNKWANGFDGSYGEFFSNWGSLFNGQPTGFRHPYWEHRNLFPEFPEFAQAGSDNGGYIPRAAPNNVKDFFQKGHSATTSLNLGATNQFGSVNFNYSHLDEVGFIAGNNLKRDNFSFGGTQKFTDRLTLSSTFNFVRTDFETPPTGAGLGSNSAGGPSVFANLFYTPRNIDLMNWPFEDPVTKGSVYYRNGNDIPNPRWVLKNARQSSLTNRFFSSSSIDYKLTDWLNATYRLGLDTYAEDQTYSVNKSGLSGGYSSLLIPGAFRSVSSNNTIFDHSFLATINKDLNESLDLTGLVGYNYRSNEYRQQGLESLNQVVFGLMEHRNFTSTFPRDFRGNNLNYKQNSAIQGVFFDATLGYKNYLYLNLSGRNDWSSTLEKENRTLFYPGASVAFIPTAAFPSIAPEVLDFLKVRLAYGTSANFGYPYSTRPTLSLNSQARVDGIGNVITSSLPSLLANPNLKPELLKETEFGLETRMFQNKIRLDFSVYNRLAEDQIIERPLDPSTGYSSSFINAGAISNKGIEATLWVTPIKRGDLTIEVGANFTRNRSKVESLPEGSKEILINGFSNLGNFAIEGKPLNVIKGTFVERSPDGQLIVNDAGDYKQANDIGIIADPNPDWFGSALFNLSWKGLSLGMQWDYVQGGQIYSFTAATMIGRGVAKDLENFDPTLSLILPGVNEVLDENDNVIGYKPNTIPLTTSGVFFSNTIIGGSPDDRGVYDATRIRFREISLSYNLPRDLVSKLKLGGISITAIGNNLWWRAVNAPKYSKADFDRTAYGSNNGAGFDYLGGPSARRYGVNLRITF